MNTCSTPVQHDIAGSVRVLLNPSICNLQSATSVRDETASRHPRDCILEPLTMQGGTTGNQSDRIPKIKTVQRLAGNEVSQLQPTVPNLSSLRPILALSRPGQPHASHPDQGPSSPGTQVLRGGSRGGRHLSEYLNAPESVRAEFDERLLAEIAAESDARRFLCESLDDDPVPPRSPLPRISRRPLRWNDSWTKRARGARSPLRENGRDFDAERDSLLALDPREYVKTLTDEAPSGDGKVACVLPSHDERTGSMHVYGPERGWFCFGCQAGGDVYNLAGFLWNLDSRSPQFREIHDRLCRIFEVAA